MECFVWWFDEGLMIDNILKRDLGFHPAGSISERFDRDNRTKTEPLEFHPPPPTPVLFKPGPGF